MKKTKEQRRSKIDLSASIDNVLDEEMDKKSINKSKLVNNLLRDFVENKELIEKYKKNK